MSSILVAYTILLTYLLNAEKIVGCFSGITATRLLCVSWLDYEDTKNDSRGARDSAARTCFCFRLQ